MKPSERSGLAISRCTVATSQPFAQKRSTKKEPILLQIRIPVSLLLISWRARLQVEREADGCLPCVPPLRRDCHPPPPHECHSRQTCHSTGPQNSSQRMTTPLWLGQRSIYSLSAYGLRFLTWHGQPEVFFLHVLSGRKWERRCKWRQPKFLKFCLGPQKIVLSWSECLTQWTVDTTRREANGGEKGWIAFILFHSNGTTSILGLIVLADLDTEPVELSSTRISIRVIFALDFTRINVQVGIVWLFSVSSDLVFTQDAEVGGWKLCLQKQSG